MRVYSETRTGFEVEISAEILPDFLESAIVTRTEGEATNAIETLAAYLAGENSRTGSDLAGYLLAAPPVPAANGASLYLAKIFTIPASDAEDGYVGADGTFLPAFIAGVARA